MSDMFFAVLPSDNFFFLDNTLSDFKIKLPVPLELTGKWYIRISEIQILLAYSSKTKKNCFL